MFLLPINFINFFCKLFLLFFEIFGDLVFLFLVFVEDLRNLIYTIQHMNALWSKIKLHYVNVPFVLEITFKQRVNYKPVYRNIRIIIDDLLKLLNKAWRVEICALNYGCLDLICVQEWLNEIKAEQKFNKSYLFLQRCNNKQILCELWFYKAHEPFGPSQCLADVYKVFYFFKIQPALICQLSDEKC